MKIRYLFIILFLLSAFFVLPTDTAKAFMASTLCSGPYTGNQLAPANLFPNKQFFCPSDQSLPSTYSCQEDLLGARTCYVKTNPLQSYDCSGNIEPTGAGNLFTGCVSTDHTAPTFPPNQRAEAVSDTQIDIFWDYSTDVDDPVEEYWIFRGPAGNTWSKIATVSHAGNILYKYSNTNLASNQLNYYYVVACDTYNNCSGIQGAVSATTLSAPIDSAPPSIPAALSAIAQSSSQINLSWTVSTDNIGVAGYRVYRNGVIIASNVTATAYSDTGLTPLTAYTYTVEAYDIALNYSGQSASAQATTLVAPDTTSPASVTNLTASSPTANSIALSWSATGDDGMIGTATLYDLRYSTAPITSANWGATTQAIGEPGPLASGTSQNMTVTGLNPLTTYYFAIKVRDEVGNESPLSNIVSSQTNATPDTTAPTFSFGSPSNLLPVGTQSANLSGSASELAICRYSGTAGQNFDSMTAMTPPGTGMNFTTTISGLSDGGSYSYYVKCRDTAPTPNISSDFAIFFSVESLIVDLSQPAISDGQPANGMAFPANTNTTTMSARTDKAAYCSFSKDTDMTFDAMTAAGNTMTADLAKTYHSINLTDLANGASYAYYIRCQGDNNGVANDSGYPISFSVINPPNTLPVAGITASPLSGNPGMVVTTNGSASHDLDGTIAQYVWQWGDGTADATGSSASHTYTTAGTYALLLTVTDNQGGKGTAQKTITVTTAIVPPEDPPASNFCAATCINDSDCVALGLNMVCAPNGICALPAGFCVPDAVGVCSNNTNCPSNGICPAPIFKKSYFTLPASKTEYFSPASFSAGTTDMIMNIETDVKAQCRYSTTPSADVDFYNSKEFMSDFSYSGATSSSVALTAPKNITTASTTYNYYIRCKDLQTGDMNTVDHPMSFTVSEQALVSGPDNYLCWINQNFIKAGIPYLFDICRANDKCIPTACSAAEPACGVTTYGTNDCGKSCSKIGPVCDTHSYSWKTSCSASCGGGTLNVWCERDNGQDMGSDAGGVYCNLPARPSEGSSCNTQSCVVNSLPSITLTANPATITSGNSSTISWSSANAISCSAGWTASTAISGSQSVSPVSSTSYAISCSGPGGTATSNAVVTVNASLSFYGSWHNEADCISNGGAVADDGTNKFCKLTSCPSGWTQYNNWSATSANACSDCGSCLTGSHSWGNIVREFCPYWVGPSCIQSQCLASIDQAGCY